MGYPSFLAESTDAGTRMKCACRQSSTARPNPSAGCSKSCASRCSPRACERPCRSRSSDSPRCWISGTGAEPGRDRHVSRHARAAGCMGACRMRGRGFSQGFYVVSCKHAPPCGSRVYPGAARRSSAQKRRSASPADGSALSWTISGFMAFVPR